MDPEDGPNINDAPVLTPAEVGGYYLAVTSGAGGSDMEFRLVPAPSVAGSLTKADTAVQPSALGSVAYMESGDLEEFISTQLGGIEALLIQINGPA